MISLKKTLSPGLTPENQPLPARVVFKAVDKIANGGRLLTVFKSQAFRDLVTRAKAA